MNTTLTTQRILDAGLGLGIALVIAAPSVALADVDHVFQDGDVIYAADVNANFSGLDDRITTYEDLFTVNETDVSTLRSDGLILRRVDDTHCGATLTLHSGDDGSAGWTFKNSDDSCTQGTLGQLHLVTQDDRVSHFVFTRDGRLGIGTPEPTQELQVAGVAQLEGLIVQRQSTNCGGGLTISNSNPETNGWNIKTSSNGCGASSLGQLHFIATEGSGSQMILTREGDLTIQGTLTESSDARLKTDVSEVRGALAGIMAIDGVSFRWLDPGRAPGLQMGVLAQDVEAVFPELVSYDEEGYRAVNYSGLIAPMIEAMQEQQAMIDDQARTIERLEAELGAVRELEARVQALESARPGPRH